ncbi:MAG: M20/M25/M40 family metallo-hydrolase [Streptosporangiales bacterium]|nr:M20/M25/M40 family metallo-hydrolase [Streptosporangiales bacterium]
MTTTQDATVRRMRQTVDALLPSVLDDLRRLVRIPSVSSDPAHAGDVRRGAELAAEMCHAAGFPEVRVLEDGGAAPAVVARIPAPPGAPTVLLYAHHDVQPTGDRAEWRSDPFEPVERDGRLYGRGTADDKAGIAAHLAAVRAHDGRPPVGVTVLLEGEEEIGSPTMEGFVERHRELLTADVIVIADAANWAIGRPALTTSLRGLADCVLEVRTLDHALHSGLWGGVAPDAFTVLARLIATLHDAQGEVAVPGLAASPGTEGPDYPAERVREEAGILDGVELTGTGPISGRLWSKPAISVIGIDAPSVADSANILHATARAKVSLRLAPGDDPATAMAALRRHLTEHAEWGARVEVHEGAAAAPYAIAAEGPAFDAARAAFHDAWGVPPVDVGVGGTIPLVAMFAERYPEAAILVTGVEDPDTRAHGANEGLHLADFANVCLAEALLLQRLGSPR